VNFGKNKGRLCVPVCVRRAEELRRAIVRAAEAGDFVEIRFDCLEAGEAAAALAVLGQLNDAARPPLIYTFRPAAEGGRSEATVPERIEFWRSLARRLAGRGGAPVFADVELSLFESESGAALADALEGWDVICSHHDFRGVPADLDGLYERMKQTPARVCKIAVAVADAADCVPLLRLLRRARGEGRDLIAVAMGAAGVWTRIVGPALGSFLTYGALDEESATAPGQLNARELRELYRLNGLDAGAAVVGLVGRPVGHSLSPRMHNAALAACGLHAVYLPFEVEDIGGFVRRLVRPGTREVPLRLRGLSVTAPHKSAVVEWLDWVEPRAREIGAVNTIVIEGEELRGYNTDAAAALVPLEEVAELKGARVAVLGAGGAARAVLWALRERGARAVVFARDAGQRRALAAEFAARSSALAGALFGEFAVVINTTPLGTSGAAVGETPATAGQLRGARFAYDLVYNPTETRFLREARESGCATIGGLPMLVAQAAEQFKLWTGEEAPVAVMRAAAESALGSE
jgi:3-dehydroquinate dehydratase / shikimate dehydrogenase